ncbi:MAG: nucleotidyltransferase family protein [Rubrivivax sp.]
MAEELHITEPQRAVLRQILERHLPAGTVVEAFGSRATGVGLKPHSDLDLLVRAPRPLSIRELADLREALSDSPLPYAVDVIEPQGVSEAFLARILAIPRLAVR